MIFRRILSILLIFGFACTHVGCAQLLVLPLFVLSLPFQILNIFIRLLPTLIKYAPLALLLVEKGDEETLDNLYNILDSYDQNGQLYSLEMCSLPEAVTCYKIIFHDNKQADDAFAATMTHILQTEPNARLLLASKGLKDSKSHNIFSIWQYMVQNNIKIGYDSRLRPITQESLAGFASSSSSASIPSTDKV